MSDEALESFRETTHIKKNGFRIEVIFRDRTRLYVRRDMAEAPDNRQTMIKLIFKGTAEKAMRMYRGFIRKVLVNSFRRI